jgi:endonuclease/exonuclease/phosphatase family metal-dependent hydrolase
MSIASAAPSHIAPSSLSGRWRRIAGQLALVAAITGAVAWQGSDRRPADATRPLELRGEVQPATRATTLRIGTFNIHGGRGDGLSVDLDATADALQAANLDVVGLYEVRGDFASDQAGELGERLHAASVFVPTEHRWWHDDFGNGLLARRPVRRVMRIDLPGTQAKRFRNAMLTTLDVGGSTISVVATHIDTAVDRDRQLEHVFELFRSLQEPAVLMGDLNCTADYPPLAKLLAEPGVTDAITAKLGPASQKGRIDHLIVRGLGIVDAAVVPTKASDHPYVWAEFSVDD